MDEKPAEWKIVSNMSGVGLYNIHDQDLSNSLLFLCFPDSRIGQTGDDTGSNAANAIPVDLTGHSLAGLTIVPIFSFSAP